MSEELLPYYNRELAFIRAMGAEFAAKYPKIASRLRLNADGSKDPHVERIVEAFAYLNARIRHKLDDDFPEISDAILSVLYPHYQRPLPSMAIMQMKLDRAQAELFGGHRVPAGTPVETEPAHGEPLRYQTAYDTRLWPCELRTAALSARPFAAPTTLSSSRAQSLLRLSLATFRADIPFKLFQWDRLRFFLHADGQSAFTLYELLMQHTLEIAIAASPQDPRPVVLPRTSLRPVGFESDEGLLPYSPRMFAGYRLLSEYFAFPQKFLFFDIVGLKADRFAGVKNQLELFFYLDRSIPDLERTVGAGNFRLGATPIVNLFKQRADPIKLTQTQTEYRVAPDARRSGALEIYSIESVRATSPRGEVVNFQPFYSFKHGAHESANTTFWNATRRPGPTLKTQDEWKSGDEVFLELVDLEFSPSTRPEWDLEIETICLNRSLPRYLPFGGNRPELDLPTGRGPIADLRCIVQPTPTVRPALKHQALWKVISHLSLNHLSLIDGQEGADALREILRLYDLTGSPDTRTLLEGVVSISAKRTVGRAPGMPGAFCRGVEVSLVLNDEKFLGSGAYLFASVLDRFLGLYVSINSFSRLVTRVTQRLNQQEPWKWPARAGEQIVL